MTKEMKFSVLISSIESKDHRGLKMSKMNMGIKKGISLSLEFALVFLLWSPASAEKTGANLQILKKEGGSVEGELIAVRDKTLFLMESSSQATVSLHLEELKELIIIRESKAWEFGGLGLISGALLGGVMGAAFTPRGSGWGAGLRQGIAGAYGAGIGAAIGVVIGTAMGIVEGINKKLVIADMTQEEQDALLTELRSISRFPKEI